MDMSSLVAGLAHPLSGADHILAMVAIGLWAAIAGGRALWAWPLAFVSAVLVGFSAGLLGLQVPLVEPAIATSIIMLGLFITLAVRAPVRTGVVIAGLFAFFHGHAHGTEAAAAGFEALPYALGFSLATSALHAIGLGAAFLIARLAGVPLVRATGGLVAMSGVALIAAIP